MLPNELGEERAQVGMRPSGQGRKSTQPGMLPSRPGMLPVRPGTPAARLGLLPSRPGPRHFEPGRDEIGRDEQRSSDTPFHEVFHKYIERGVREKA
jgi:hypothetical protein